MGSSSQPPDPQGTGPPPARQRVLLVEDDPEAALFVVYALAKRGRFEVTHTADPVAALALAAAERWDLALTDLDLPVMSGVELTRELRSISPGLPVLLLTAHSPAEVPIPEGCRPDVLLAKPVSAEALLAAAVAAVAGGASGHR
jgi:two-component system response regulator HydG